MCLVITKRFTAKKPIFIYKVGFTVDFMQVFHSPITDWNFPFNTLCLDPNYKEIWNKGRKKGDEVYGGFIHSYKTYSKAFIMYDKLRSKYYCYGKCFIFRAIIPVGSVGFYGEDHEICSNKIIILNPNLLGYEKLCKEYGLDPSSNKFP